MRYILIQYNLSLYTNKNDSEQRQSITPEYLLLYLYLYYISNLFLYKYMWSVDLILFDNITFIVLLKYDNSIYLNHLFFIVSNFKIVKWRE